MAGKRCRLRRRVPIPRHSQPAPVLGTVKRKRSTASGGPTGDGACARVLVGGVGTGNVVWASAYASGVGRTGNNPRSKTGLFHLLAHAHLLCQPLRGATMRSATLGFLVLLGLTANASAQTAEETVAFLLTGAEEGANVVRFAKEDTLKKVSSTPAIFQFTRNIPLDGDIKNKLGGASEGTFTYKIEVKQTESCVFDVEISRGLHAGKLENGSKQHGIVDAKKMKDIHFQSVNLDKSTVLQIIRPVPDAKCELSENGVVKETLNCEFMSLAERPRIIKALMYLKSTYCKEQAF